jgi:hypothetical protein
MWLSGNSQPDFRTINRFRGESLKEDIKSLFTQIVLLLQTAGYYGCKKASEPLHILWDCNSDKIKVANNTGKGYTNLSAEIAIYNMDGTLQYTNTIQTDIAEDEVKECFTVAYPDGLSDVHLSNCN